MTESPESIEEQPKPASRGDECSRTDGERELVRAGRIPDRREIACRSEAAAELGRLDEVVLERTIWSAMARGVLHNRCDEDEPEPALPTRATAVRIHRTKERET